jgi:transcription elongation GreA/GreB family factor
MGTELASRIAQGDVGGVEDAWLARLAEDAGDAAFFTGTLRALLDAGHDDTAGFLLQMLDEHLQAPGQAANRLRFLRAGGDLIHAEPLPLHDDIVRSLARKHEGSPLQERLAEKVGLHRAPDDIPKTWDKVDRLEDLMALAPGTVVAMEGKGAGRIAEVNLQLDSFRVALAGGATISVGFAAAKKMLQPLPSHHVLRRKLEEPEALAALKEQRPEELVRLVLASYPEPLTGNEIRQALAGVVGDAEWTAFWNRARKSPHVVAEAGARQRYHWAETVGAALDTVRGRFDTADLDGRLELLRSHGDRDPELKRDMVRSIATQAAGLRASDPTMAFQAAMALERAGAAGEAGLDAAGIVAGADDPVRVLGAVSDRVTREEGYRRLAAAHADWQPLFEKALLREEDPRVLDLIADRLGAAGSGQLERVVGELLTQPRKYPAAFTWLAERAARDEALLQRSPLRLFQQILAAAADSSFAAHKKRLLKLADSGGTLPRLLPALDPAQAPQAEEAVGKAPGLEEYQRQALKNAIHLRFPELHQSEEQPLYARPDTIVRKREELRELLEVEIPANRRAIEEARALGDLRENFEYKSARQRHEYLAARATGLDRDLRRARPIDPAKVDFSAVRVGTRMRLTGAAGEERWITLLGPWDSAPERGVLSNESDLAGTLLGKLVGDAVQVEGKGYRIAEILPYE